jgi:uncharacterized protein (TIGR03437 family)
MESMDITVQGVGSELPALAAVSAASYAAPLSSEMLVALFGQNLSSTSEAAAALPLPASLAGMTVIIKDSLQVERPGSLLFVSPAQINLVMPAGVAPGSAMVMVKDEGNNIRDLGFATVTSTSPGVFTANANGLGVPAGALVRVKPGNVQSYEAILAFDQSQGAYVPIPVDLGPDTEVVVLVLFGTGWRNVANPSNVSVRIGDVACPVEFVGKQPTMEGLDQLNARLPGTLIGRAMRSFRSTLMASSPTSWRLRLSSQLPGPCLLTLRTSIRPIQSLPLVLRGRQTVVINQTRHAQESILSTQWRPHR